MNNLQDLCVDKIVQKGHPKPLNEILPRILCPTIVNRIMDANKPKWEEDINLVHLDLLIESGKLNLDSVKGDGYYTFTYYDAVSYYCWKLHGDCYEYFGEKEKKLYNTTLKYINCKG